MTAEKWEVVRMTVDGHVPVGQLSGEAEMVSVRMGQDEHGNVVEVVVGFVEPVAELRPVTGQARVDDRQTIVQL